MAFIPYGKQDISEKDIRAITDVLRSDFLTQGPAVPAFEAALSQYCNAKYAVAMNSATSALHIACLALGLGPGDIAWTTPISFVASANCVLYCGAEIDFVDICKDGVNICADAFAQKLNEASAVSKLPKVLIAVHMAGHSPEMDRIKALADQYDISIIEDASHSIGASFKGQKVGDCSHSDITIFSFHPVKIITTAEGGVATTNDDVLAHKMQMLRSHGITRDAGLMQDEPHGSWYYEQLDLGYNYRMTDILAALGHSQMSRLDAFVKKRQEIAARYDELLNHHAIKKPVQSQNVYASWHLYVIQIDHTKVAISKKDLFDAMIGLDIGVNLHYIPIHLQPYYRKLGFQKGSFPVSELYYKRAMSIPVYPNLSASDQDRVIDALYGYLDE